MQKKVIKVIQAVVVAASMAVGFLFYQRFQPESFMKEEGEAVSMADIHADPTGNHAGKTAGEDIPRLTGREELEQLIVGDYAAITTKEIMATNVYSLKPWVDPYSLTKIRLSSGRTASTGRRASEATKGPGARAEAYQEYYLVRLPDSAYCLAQFSAAYERKIKQEEEITLPIGQKQTTSHEAREYLADICREYGADPSYLLYMVDDGWGEANHFTLFLIRFGAAVGVFFVLAVGLFLLLGKVFPMEDEWGR